MRPFNIILTFFVLSVMVVSSALAVERAPAVAGMFYPADAAELEGMVKAHLAAVSDPVEIDGQIIALVVPHAGLVYSGQVAAYGYKLLEHKSISTVILCGPSHRHAFTGLSVYGPFVKWRTPLGAVACDDALCDQLLKFNKNINVVAKAHEQEHCLEVQLPYLQTVLGNFKIVPIIIGNQDKSTVELLADALTSLKIDKNTVLVASSDWQHYRPASVGSRLDSAGLQCMLDMDPDKLYDYIAGGKTELCGGGAAAAVIKAAMAHGADKVKLLKYGDSGDISGDKSSVVGYAALAFYKSTGAEAETSAKPSGSAGKPELPQQLSLDDADQALLLDIARTSIESYLTGEEPPDFEISDNVAKYGAAFVTLEKNGQLRGCIGYTTASGPLYECVSECAVKAAVSDPRFPPVTRDELGNLHIEISVLSPLQKVKVWDEIVVGRDGLMIFKGAARGLLLPQVAVEYSWDRTTFLEQTCLKAGLKKNDYLSADAVVYKFQATIFGE